MRYRAFLQLGDKMTEPIKDRHHARRMRKLGYMHEAIDAIVTEADRLRKLANSAHVATPEQLIGVAKAVHFRAENLRVMLTPPEDDEAEMPDENPRGTEHASE